MKLAAPQTDLDHRGIAAHESISLQADVGVFLPNWVGDAVLCTPALRALKDALAPAARLVGIMRPQIAEVLDGIHWFDEQILFDPRGKDPGQRMWGTARAIRRARLDTIVLFPNSVRTALVAALARVPRRIGFVRFGRRILLTHRLYHARGKTGFLAASVLDDYLKLVHVIGANPRRAPMELATLPADEARADEIWQRLKIPPSAEVVSLNCSGAYGAAKLWPAERFAELARRIVRSLNLHVLALCGPAERETARQIRELSGEDRVASLDQEVPSLGLTKACIKRSRLLVSTDSGPRHFAAAFGVRVVTIFGPTDPLWSENYFGGDVHVQKSLPCVPCQARVCPLKHHRCMLDLTVDEVFHAVSNVLQESARQNVA